MKRTVYSIEVPLPDLIAILGHLRRAEYSWRMAYAQGKVTRLDSSFINNTEEYLLKAEEARNLINEISNTIPKC